MTNQQSKVPAVAWSEVFPWWSLVRVFRLAIGPRLLVLGALGGLLMVCGWTVLGLVFSGTDDPVLAEQTRQLAPEGKCPWSELIAIVPDRPTWPQGNALCPIGRVAAQLSRPFVGMFDPRVGVTGFVFWLLCGLWALAVWAAFGAGITRTAAVQLAAGERIGWGAMLGHVRRKWTSYLGAPLFPILGVLLATVPMLCVGVLLLNGVTLWIAAILWPVLVLGGLLMAVLLVGLAVGWPLMWATISAEGKDSFDALSRAYAYAFQRPLHYLFYAAVAAALGIAGWVLVSSFAALVIQMTCWAASWGCGHERIEQIVTGDASLGAFGDAGAVLLRFWIGCVKLVAVGFLYSYFWTAAVAVYFLLRRDVDATELDEVCLDEEAPSHYTLPPVGTDHRGAPVVDENTSPEAAPPDEATPEEPEDASDDGRDMPPG